MTMKTILCATAVLALTSVSAHADTASAVRAYDAGLLNIAAGEFLREAEMGDAEAQYRLGMMYTAGDWFEPDREEAVRWVGAAAIQGHPEALHRLASLTAAESLVEP